MVSGDNNTALRICCQRKANMDFTYRWELKNKTKQKKIKTNSKIQINKKNDGSQLEECL